MKIIQRKFIPGSGWTTFRNDPVEPQSCNLLLVYGGTALLHTHSFYDELRAEFANADIIINSTAGEISGKEVCEESLSLTAIHFEKTKLKVAVVDIHKEGESFEAGRVLAAAFDPEGLKNVLIISDGLKVNGSILVKSLQQFLPQGTIITGGLAGDAAHFHSTLVGVNDNPAEGKIAAIGFYGDQLTVTYGSVGGWDPFGTERLITKSVDNILYELDGKPALDIYKKYLGEYAKDLPGSGLLFPLSVRDESGSDPVVRTLLGIDEAEKSIRFAGNIPEGKYARLMKANFERLIEGASLAAKGSISNALKAPDLAILISCVGRKLVLMHRVEEEVEVVSDQYGESTAITGFYSYGEISPSYNISKCKLHNQTMTITTFTET